MAGANAPETIRKALAMGAAGGIHVSDASLAGSDVVSTARVLAAALRELEADLILAGADTSDGGRRRRAAGRRGAPGLPYLSYAAKIEPDPAAGTVRVNRISPTGYDVLEAPMPALIVVHAGPRRAALPLAQGDHGGALQDGRGRPLAAVGVGRRRSAGRRGGRHEGPRGLGAAAARRRRGSSATRRTRPPARSWRSSPSGGSSDGRRHLGPRRDEVFRGVVQLPFVVGVCAPRFRLP